MRFVSKRIGFLINIQYTRQAHGREYDWYIYEDDFQECVRLFQAMTGRVTRVTHRGT